MAVIFSYLTHLLIIISNIIFFKPTPKLQVVEKIPIDNIAPVISINNDFQKEIYIDENFIMPKITAYDNFDGDISDQVIVNGTINNRTLGPQSLDYSVADHHNNKAEFHLSIIVKNRPYDEKSKSNGLPILMYHFFYDKSKGEKSKGHLWMETGEFEKQLEYLVDNNYYFPTWEEVDKFVKKEISLPEKSIVITIDDGNPTFFKLAIPLLEKYKVKATSFVVGNRVTKEELGKYLNDLINFGSHSYNLHNYDCGKVAEKCMSEKEFVADLKTSIDVVDNNIVYCYPFGVVDNRTKLVKEAGFKIALTTIYGKVYPGDNPYLLKRIRLNDGVSMNQFIQKITK